MKKALSLVLAILMIFSVLTVGSFAEGDVSTEGEGTTVTTDSWHAQGALTAEQVVLSFTIDGGTYSTGHYVYDLTAPSRDKAFIWKTPAELQAMGDPYVMIPLDDNSQKPGQTIALPDVDGKAGYTFVGWYCYTNGSTYAPGYTGFRIPEKDSNGVDTKGTVMEFLAVYRPAKVEEDTFAKVFDILAKIFGTIIGLIAYEGNTEAGIAFVKKIFSGITG